MIMPDDFVIKIRKISKACLLLFLRTQEKTINVGVAINGSEYLDSAIILRASIELLSV